ncbi:hypothetical protein HELRODRAFT_191851 [Helobdella robusta]|uniref:Multifunctional fusion protein n=1 Tax=Helobdella robusta TaxID=6412 RepID=T1FTC7_HELRO|nr:hypothetical protein HELRODRAFT_191851 [Helobdella robusta]ESO03519.1 hypothetical protein HELRODRAFT_191851 [Helobdella robusta]
MQSMKKFLLAKPLRFYSSYTYQATNEPILSYEKGTKERDSLIEKLKNYNSGIHEVPIVVGDKEYTTDIVKYQVKPHDHKSRLAKFYYADKALLNKAIDVSQCALRGWDLTPFEEKANIFAKAVDLIRGKYRFDLVASTMLGQGKTIVQAEIDAACELADFFSFNVKWANEARQWQPISAGKAVNRLEWRAMEGFWASISPFNFTAIGGHLAGAPAFMGNVVLWKPSDTAILSNYIVFKLLREAGLPPGVINFVPSDGPVFGDVITRSPFLAGVNFTGSSRTFEAIWRNVGDNISTYKSFPRLIGECGGKNYHLIHRSAVQSQECLEHIVNSTIRSAFEYSGQKCSACSRCYVPKSLWPRFRDGLVDVVSGLRLGSPLDVGNFLSAVIDGNSYKKIRNYIDQAKKDGNLKIVCGGGYDESIGYYIQPTIIETTDPKNLLMYEEIFGPVLTVYAYEDDEYDDILKLIDSTSQYALTGAVFIADQEILLKSQRALRYSAGNFYINDKSTGSIVAQQPFGGSRKSGTNDKAGSPQYIMRFVNPQSIKSQSELSTRVDYDYMKDPLEF